MRLAFDNPGVKVTPRIANAITKKHLMNAGFTSTEIDGMNRRNVLINREIEFARREALVFNEMAEEMKTKHASLLRANHQQGPQPAGDIDG